MVPIPNLFKPTSYFLSYLIINYIEQRKEKKGILKIAAELPRLKSIRGLDSSITFITPQQFSYILIPYFFFSRVSRGTRVINRALILIHFATESYACFTWWQTTSKIVTIDCSKPAGVSRESESKAPKGLTIDTLLEFSVHLGKLFPQRVGV